MVDVDFDRGLIDNKDMLGVLSDILKLLFDEKLSFQNEFTSFLTE
jgi:hypothetical protein